MRPKRFARRFIVVFWRRSNLMSGMSYAHRGRLSASGRGGVLLHSVQICSRPRQPRGLALQSGARAVGPLSHDDVEFMMASGVDTLIKAWT
jgi:hypothetical protein